MDSMNIWFTCLNLVLSVLMIPASFASDKECWNESKACVVSGTLETRVYPGPPEYEDIKKGDAKEEGLYLKLDHPLTIHFKDWDKSGAPATESISLMHIAGEFDVVRFYKLAEMKKKPRITIKGKIFESFNAHHHTHFLLDPDNNIIVDKK
jgi:hypothetical protein